MRQLYYTFQPLLNRRGLFMGILLFARVTFELSFDNHYYEADKVCAVNVTVHYKDGEKKGPYHLFDGSIVASVTA